MVIVNNENLQPNTRKQLAANHDYTQTSSFRVSKKSVDNRPKSSQNIGKPYKYSTKTLYDPKTVKEPKDAMSRHEFRGLFNADFREAIKESKKSKKEL